MSDKQSIESLIMTLDLCEHYLPQDLPSVHRANLRRIKRLLREIAGSAQTDANPTIASIPSNAGVGDDR